MIEAKVGRGKNRGWIICGSCGHKLFRSVNGGMISGIEIKCHSCKEINTTDQTWVFTFGCGQENAGHYVKFTGTYSEAREKMCAKYGDKWAFQYSLEEWADACRRGFARETELKED